MRFILNIIYSVFIYPAILVLAHLWAGTNKSIRMALRARYQYRYHLLSGIKKLSESKKRVLIHTASMGEFEHIKPLISKLSQQYNTEIVVTFFSPSGYENVREFPGVQFFMYLPFDFKWIWKRFYKILKPNLIVISKHDVWPNQVWTAKALGMPVYLINASLAQESSRRTPLNRYFQKYIYRSLTEIFTISEQDASRFQISFPNCRIRQIGDTKFDQVLLRKKASEKKIILSEKWVRGKLVLLCGSVWPEDTRVLFPAIKQMISRFQELRLVIVPHQPDPKYLKEIEQIFKKDGLLFYSEIQKLEDQKVLLVDKIGILADLYKDASLAYVGGGFHQGIHNVMEPAAYGIPVMFGPTHTNASEAEALLAAGGGKLIVNSDEAIIIIEKFLSHSQSRKKVGANAIHFAREHTGATEKLLKIWHQENQI